MCRFAKRVILSALTAVSVALPPVTVRAQVAAAAGPCEQPDAIGAIVDRPGLGRPTANNGSPCVVPPARVLVEAGYRDQTTGGDAGASTLVVFPLALLRIGLGARSEIVVQPPAKSIRGGATLGGTFARVIGSQDLGFGVKHMLDDRASFQDSVGIFYTGPTGVPQGATGFSAGGPTYTLTYTAAFAVTPTLGFSLTQNASANSVPLAQAGGAHFFSYQPSLTVSYAFAPNFTFLISDQITAPLAPGAGTGNRALVALQRVISRKLVLDAEYEVNALPTTPALRQHAFGVGGAFEF